MGSLWVQQWMVEELNIKKGRELYLECWQVTPGNYHTCLHNSVNTEFFFGCDMTSHLIKHSFPLPPELCICWARLSYVDWWWTWPFWLSTSLMPNSSINPRMWYLATSLNPPTFVMPLPTQFCCTLAFLLSPILVIECYWSKFHSKMSTAQNIACSTYICRAISLYKL